MPNRIVLYVLLSFVSGFLFNSLVITAEPANISTGIHNQPASNLDKTTYSSNELTERLDELLIAVNELTNRVDEISLNQNIDIKDRPNNFAKSNNPDDYVYQQDEIERIKTSIYNDTLNSNLRFKDLIASHELNALPEHERKAVFDEIARRIDSGEIQMHSFLPDYKPGNE